MKLQPLSVLKTYTLMQALDGQDITGGMKEEPLLSLSLSLSLSFTFSLSLSVPLSFSLFLQVPLSHSLSLSLSLSLCFSQSLSLLFSLFSQSLLPPPSLTLPLSLVPDCWAVNLSGRPLVHFLTPAFVLS